MIINVSGYDFTSSLTGVRTLEAGVSHAQSAISSAVSDSKMHMDTCNGKAQSRLGNWEKKLSSLKSKLSSLRSEEQSLKSQIADLKARIEDVKGQIYSVKREIESVESQLASLRPPIQKKVYYEDEKGNTHSYTVVDDPDADKRARLQARLSELQAKLRELNKKLDELEKSLAELQKRLKEVQLQIKLVTEDIETAKEYIELMRQTKEYITQAKSSLEQVNKYVTDYSSGMYEDCESAESAIEQLRDCVDRYNSKSYQGCEYKGRAPYMKSPALSGASFGAGSYAPVSRPGKRTDVERSPSLPAKMRYKSEKDKIVDIVGVYEDQSELSSDISKVVAIVGAKMTFRVKKPTTSAITCFENVKLLSDFMESKGFKPKLTAMGTRFTDADGCLRFVS